MYILCISSCQLLPTPLRNKSPRTLSRKIDLHTFLYPETPLLSQLNALAMFLTSRGLGHYWKTHYADHTSRNV